VRCFLARRLERGISQGSLERASEQAVKFLDAPPLALAEAAPCSFDSRKKAESFSSLKSNQSSSEAKPIKTPAGFPSRVMMICPPPQTEGIEDLAAVLQGRQSVYEIFEANKPMLAHPDKIYPGQVLWIP
jgi:hypothetical protein